MITCSAWSGKKYAVLGLARSGRASVEALLASGAEVLAWDSKPEAREAFVGRAALADPVEADLTGYAGVVVSPGVPLNTHPIAAHAKRYGVPVIGDIELFAQTRAELPPHKVVGITGTNGKSTTTALVHHILKTAGVPTTMGGNIGLPILEQEPLPEGGVYVLELSSYQIDLTFSLDCDVAVLLNITPDHLERYDSFDAYADAKLRLFEMQSAGQYVIVDNETDALFGPTDASPDPGIIFTDMIEDFGDRLDMNLQSDWAALQGPHNRANAASAIAVGHALEIDTAEIAKALRTYPGLPHRMERVAEFGGVAFVNDSKGTNTAATAPALAVFGNVHWIVGGLAKKPEENQSVLGECEEHLGRVKAAYTIGAFGLTFARLLEGRVPVEHCGTLDRAVAAAAAAAESGDIVLLSPACASFDQYRDFEERGEAFRRLVHTLAGKEAA